jgi:hypothetical protein
VSWTRDPGGVREVRNFLGPLYHQSQQDEGRTRTLNILWPLFTHRLRANPSGTGDFFYERRTNVLGPVFILRTDNYGRGYVDADFLWPLGQYFRGEKRTGDTVRSVIGLRFLPFFRSEWSWSPLKPSRGGALRLSEEGDAREEELHADERMYFRLVNVLFGMDMEPTGRRMFLLGGAPVDDDGNRTTFGIVAHENGPSIDFEHQLLWRAFLVKRWGSARIASPANERDAPSDFWRSFQWMWRGPPRSLVRVGPVAVYQSDWEADTARFSVLAGLFSYERHGTSRRGRLLWFLPWSFRRSGG